MLQHNISSSWRRRSYSSCSVSCYSFRFNGFYSLLEGRFRRYCSCIWSLTIHYSDDKEIVGKLWKLSDFFVPCHGHMLLIVTAWHNVKIFILWLNFIITMPINKNALLRYKTIDRCLRNKYRRWTLDDLVEACSEALYDAVRRTFCRPTVCNPSDTKARICSVIPSIIR